MPGWVPFDADGWPEVAAALAGCRPWPEAAAAFHLRWLRDRQPDRPLPGRPALRVLFGWTDWKVRALLRSEAWQDPSRRQRAASSPPARLQPTSSRPPAATTANANNPPVSASAHPADLQRASSSPPARLHTRKDPPSPSPSPSPSQEQQQQPPDAPAVPAWLDKWRKSAKDVPRSFKRLDVARFASRAVEAMTGRPLPKWPPSQGHARPALRVWRRLGYAPLGDLDGDPWQADPATAIGQVALLRLAAEHCPDPLFRNHIRGIRANGERWRDPPRLTAGVVWRLDPPNGSSGATVEDRLAAALEWHANGRPSVPDADPLPSWTPSTGGKPSAFLGDVFASRGQDVAGMPAAEPSPAVRRMLERKP